MLAGAGVEFLYTAISRCKAPAAGFPYIHIFSHAGHRRSHRALSFWRESAGLLNGAL